MRAFIVKVNCRLTRSCYSGGLSWAERSEQALTFPPVWGAVKDLSSSHPLERLKQQSLAPPQTIIVYRLSEWGLGKSKLPGNSDVQPTSRPFGSPSHGLPLVLNGVIPPPEVKISSWGQKIP